MEALTLSSPMVIIVVGLPGSGKSFFASRFADTFGSALVSRDKIRWTLFSHHTYSDNENSMVNQVSDLITSELFRTKKTFVLDGGYNTKSKRHELSTLAKKHGFRVLTIVVQTDRSTSFKRSLKRDARKSGDQYKQSLTSDEFEKQEQSYSEPNTAGRDVVVISGKHTYNTQARIVLKKIIETRGGTIAPPINIESTKRVTIKPRGPFVQ